jgi:hypothetical protein
LHKEKFMGLPLAEGVVLPRGEVEFGAAAFADAAEGEVGVEFALFFVGGGGFDGGLELFEGGDVAGEADPEDAGVAEGGEGTEAVGAEVECACTRGQTVRAPRDGGGEAGLDLFKVGDGNVAEELEGEMDLVFGGPADGVRGFTG